VTPPTKSLHAEPDETSKVGEVGRQEWRTRLNKRITLSRRKERQSFLGGNGLSFRSWNEDKLARLTGIVGGKRTS